MFLMNSHQDVRMFLSFLSYVIIWGKSLWRVLHLENVLYQKLRYFNHKSQPCHTGLFRRFEIEACKINKLILGCTGSHLEQRWGDTRHRKSHDGIFRRRQSLLNDIMVSEELTCLWNPVQCFISSRVTLRLRGLFERLANASYMRLSDVEKEGGVSTGWRANSQWDIQSRSFQHPPAALKHPRRQEYLDFISDEDRRLLLQLCVSAYLQSRCAARPEKRLESTQRVSLTWVSSHLHRPNLTGRFHRNANVICKYRRIWLMVCCCCADICQRNAWLHSI